MKLFVASIHLNQRDQTRWWKCYKDLDWCGFEPELCIRKADGYTWSEIASIEYDKKDENIAENYKWLRKKFLKSGLEWCLFWEDDVYPPKDALRQFYYQKLDAVGLVTRNWDPCQRIVGNYSTSWYCTKNRKNAQTSKWDIIYDWRNPNATGLGFVLVHRKVLEKIDFYYGMPVRGIAGTDINFWIDVNLAGFKYRVVGLEGTVHREYKKETKKEKIARVLKEIEPIFGYCGKEEAELFESLNLGDNPTILELGTMMGRSAEMLRLLYPDADIHTCDPNFHCDMVALENFSHCRGKDLLGWNLPIDLLYVDDEHTYQSQKDAFEKFEPFVKQGGYVVFHDYLYPGDGVKKFVDSLNGCDIKDNSKTGGYKIAVWHKK